jgi:hypothetical protein
MACEQSTIATYERVARALSGEWGVRIYRAENLGPLELLDWLRSIDEVSVTMNMIA